MSPDFRHRVGVRSPLTLCLSAILPAAARQPTAHKSLRSILLLPLVLKQTCLCFYGNRCYYYILPPLLEVGNHTLPFGAAMIMSIFLLPQRMPAPTPTKHQAILCKNVLHEKYYKRKYLPALIVPTCCCSGLAGRSLGSASFRGTASEVC